MDTLSQLALQLEALGSPPDSAQLRAQMDHLGGRYRAALEDAGERIARIKEIPQIIDKFFETHQTVLDWVQQIEVQLSVPPPSQHPDYHPTALSADTDRLLQVCFLLSCLYLYINVAYVCLYLCLPRMQWMSRQLK